MSAACPLVLGLAVVAGAACAATTFVPPPPSPTRVYELGEVDERPEIVLTPPLHYPDDPRVAETEGVVVVQLVVDTAGNPEPATLRVVQAPDSGLGLAGRALVARTLFRPARVRGRVQIPVNFRLPSRD